MLLARLPRRHCDGAERARQGSTFTYDLIVIGSRGKGGIGRLLLGSVSEAVARDAPCPVLIVRKGTTSAG